MMMKDFTERDPRTHAIIGAAMEVHKQLGCGFLEPVYQEALALEFISRRIPFRREVRLPVHYKGQVLVTAYCADFICFDSVVVELKALARMSGTEERHPLGSPPPAPIGSGSDYSRDVERARRFEPLVREGHADSLIEASLRYVIAHSAVSTVLVGYSTMDHLEYAARGIEKGPLSPAALARVAEIQRSLAGEPR